MRVAGKPVNGVDLVDQPLIGNTGRVGPEEAELQIFASVEWLIGPVEQVALPVRILFLQERHNTRAPPTAWLIHVPGHFDSNDVTEFTRLNVLVSLLIAGRAAALGTDSYDLSRLLHRGAKRSRILHGVSGGLLHIGVAACLHRFYAMQGVLKISSSDNDGIDILAGIELVVVADAGNGPATALLLNKGRTLVTATVPDIRDGDELEVEFLGMILERRYQ